MAQRELGGGALLDESHWIDLMLWLFGAPAEVSGRIGKISPLEIDSDDNVDLAFVYERGPRVTMHLDLYGRPHEKFIRFVGTKGTLLWSADPNETRVAHGWKQEWQTQPHTCERNDMFMGVAREFLDVIGGGRVTTCSIADGVRVLDIIEAARKASDTGCAVALGR
jgi:predicted dehydrogenase